MSKFLEGLTRPLRSPMTVTNPPNGDKSQHSPIRIGNRVRFRVVSPEGDIKQETPWFENVLTTYGLASLASVVGSSAGVTLNAANSNNFIQACYIGTSATAPTSSDTSLGASTASLTIGNNSFMKTNTGNMTVEYQATFASSNPTGSCTINEIGLYCNSTGNETQNHLAAHATLATNVVKGASDVLQSSYQIIFTTA